MTLCRATGRVSLLKPNPFVVNPMIFGVRVGFSEKNPVAKNQFFGENSTRCAAYSQDEQSTFRNRKCRIRLCHGANKDNLEEVVTRRLLRFLSDTPDI